MSRRGHGSDGTDDETALWRLAVQDVVPLLREPASTNGKVPPKRAKPAAGETGAVIPMPLPPLRARVAATTTQEPARDLDKRTRQRLERGEMAIEAVLDLHGHSQEQAYGELVDFITRTHRAGLRCVLVITGKGRGGAGVLKARLPQWVDEPPLRPLILRAVPARQNHGGGGAFYVLLRRTRG